MAINLSDLIGGDGGGSSKGPFQVTYFSGALLIPSGSSGTLLTITPPAGKRAKLLWLTSDTEDYGSITIERSNTGVVINDTVAAYSTSRNNNQYIIGTVGGSVDADYSNSENVGALYDGVLGDIDESIIVKIWDQQGGSTNQALYYSYAYGDC